MYTRGNVDQIRAAISVTGAQQYSAIGRQPTATCLRPVSLLMRLADFRAALRLRSRAHAGGEAPRPAGLVVTDFISAPATIYGRAAAANFNCERGMARAAEPGAVIPNFFGFESSNLRSHQPRRNLVVRGFSEQARGIAEKAVDGAASRDDPLTTCVALTYCSPVFLWSGDFRTAGDYVERPHRICKTTLA